MQDVTSFNQHGRSETDGMGENSTSKLRICLPVSIEPLEDLVRAFETEDSEAQDTASSSLDPTNVIRPRIRQWSGDTLKQALERLAENLTHEQLAIFQKTVEELYGKNVAIDIFSLLFGAILDQVPNIFSLTPTQRISLGAQMVERCAYAMDKCVETLRSVEFNI